MKKDNIIKIALLLFCAFAFLGFVFYSTLKVKNPTADICNINTEKIIAVNKHKTDGIILSDSHGDHYYIEHGLKQGLNLDSLSAKVLNKTVTLHLPKVLGGFATSEHIAQIAVGDTIIFSELK